MNFTRNAVTELQQRRTAPLTPLIDVVFLLLIFLLFGDFRHEEGHVASRMEAADTAAAAVSGRIVMTVRQEAGSASVSIRRPGTPRALYSAGLEQFDVREIRRALRAAGITDMGERVAVIGTEGAVDFRHIMTLWDRCRQLGFGDVGLQTGAQE